MNRLEPIPCVLSDKTEIRETVSARAWASWDEARKRQFVSGLRSRALSQIGIKLLKDSSASTIFGLDVDFRFKFRERRRIGRVASGDLQAVDRQVFIFTIEVEVVRLDIKESE